VLEGRIVNVRLLARAEAPAKIVAAVLVAGLLGIAVVAAPTLMVALTTAFILAWGGCFALGRVRSVDADEVGFLRRLFVGAVLARLAVAISTFYLLPYGFFAPDEIGYASSGSSVGLAGGHGLADVQGVGWVYFNNFLTAIFGDAHMLLPRVWNALVGAAVPLLVYVIAKRLGGVRSARVSGVLTAFFPSIVLWSSLNLKDADVHVLVLCAVVLSLNLQERIRIRYAIGLALVGLVLFTLRPYLLLPLGAFVVLAQMMARRRSSQGIGRMLFVSAFAAVVIVALRDLPGWLSSVPNAETLSAIRSGFTQGAGSAFIGIPSPSSWTTAIQTLPAATLNFVLGPFPWQSGSALVSYTKPEMLVYYALLPGSVAGAWHAFKRNPDETLPLVVLAILIVLGYSLVVFNFGTAYRLRALVMLFILVFAPIGHSEWRRRSSTRFGRGTFQAARHASAARLLHAPRLDDVRPGR
jgi:4-amino-4-deoxy-L-arabinose transferase-like glycosyltransferase